MIEFDDIYNDPDKDIAQIIDCCQWVPYTWQGEGNNIGQPVSMLRFSKCNLACPWCDSDDMMKNGPVGLSVTFGEITKAVQKTGTFMFTGGEPLTITKNRHWMLWLTDAVWAFNGEPIPHVSIETNGLKANEEVFNDLITMSHNCKKLTVVWSPKFLDYMTEALKEPWSFLNGLLDITALHANIDFCIKVVAPLETRVFHTFKRIIGCSDVGPERVYLMPQGMSPEQVLESTPKTLEQCKRLGARFSPRVQVSYRFE